VIVEIKTVDKLLKVHDAQVFTYFKLSGIGVGFRSISIPSRTNGLLGNHPVMKGINRIVTFTGQSLSSKLGTSLLLLGDSAKDLVGCSSAASLRSLRLAGHRQWLWRSGVAGYSSWERQPL
jgi:hypothetical protein